MQDAETEPVGDSRSTSIASEPAVWWPRMVHWSAWIAVIVYCALLLQRARAWHRLTADEPGMQLADLIRIRGWAVDFVVLSLKTSICFGLLGFLVAVALTEKKEPRRWHVRLRRGIVGVLPGVGLLVLLAVTETGQLPTLAYTVFPVIGYALGAWIGRTAWRGPWALARLLPTFALLLLLPLAALVCIVALAVDNESFAFEPPSVTPAEKHRLAELLTDPQLLADGSRSLRLSENDVNLMLAMAATQVLSDAKGQIVLENERVISDFSIPVGASGPEPVYVNVHMDWYVATKEARPVIRLEHCHVGRLPIPGFVLNVGMNQAQAILANDPDLRKIPNAIGSLRVEPRFVEAVLISRGVAGDVLPSLLARLGRSPDVTSRARIYYRHLVDKAERMPKEERFERLVAAAFQLARDRSRDNDPVLENRAAVLTLAILLGHPRVEHLVGPVTDPELRRNARRHLRGVTLRGRSDWCHHFFVSAALALISNPKLADQAGLFKEEADSADGGSGFSFSDLLADRAGTRFALAATRDEAAARRNQQRLADGFAIGILFPEAADLPEGIPDAQMQSEFGGPGGEKYEALVGEIQRRLDECETLR